jgi:hypothetical protein
MHAGTAVKRWRDKEGMEGVMNGTSIEREKKRERGGQRGVGVR